MTGKDQVLATSDAASIALLRRLRSGEDVPFVHRADVCSAAPAELVANLQPVPGTDLAENGYNSVWYFFCTKKYKNSTGKAAGHRQRAIGGGDTCWHAEVRAKEVQGSGGGTFCNLSYGRKKAGSGRSFERMGWCLVEYDDDKITSNNAGGDHVLCKVYRSSSSLAKKSGKSGKTPSMSSSSISSSTSSKRKAEAEDHPEGDERPTKLVHHTQPQDNTPMTTDDYYRSIYDEPAVDLASYTLMKEDGDRRGVQQPLESEQGTPFSNNYYQHPMPPCDEPHQGVDLAMFGQQPHAQLGQGGDCFGIQIQSFGGGDDRVIEQSLEQQCQGYGVHQQCLEQQQQPHVDLGQGGDCFGIQSFGGHEEQNMDPHGHGYGEQQQCQGYGVQQPHVDELGRQGGDCFGMQPFGGHEEQYPDQQGQIYGMQQPHVAEQVPSCYQQQPQYHQYGDLLTYQNQVQQQRVQALIKELGDLLAQEVPDFFDEQGTSCSAQPGNQLTTGAGQQVLGRPQFF
ncbi:hypothetical protein BS78_01G027100 [Paspalum vaginatum]|nr:hypothetical protein BS78_01G027100 [Paspalum vaginatum]